MSTIEAEQRKVNYPRCVWVASLCRLHACLLSPPRFSANDVISYICMVSVDEHYITGTAGWQQDGDAEAPLTLETDAEAEMELESLTGNTAHQRFPKLGLGSLTGQEDIRPMCSEKNVEETFALSIVCQSSIISAQHCPKVIEPVLYILLTV